MNELLICPSNGHGYDPGWVVQLTTDPPQPGLVVPLHEESAE